MRGPTTTRYRVDAGNDRATAENGRVGGIVLESNLERIAADLQLIAVMQYHPHASAERTAVVQDRARGADVLDPVVVVGVDDLRLHPGDHSLGIRESQRGIVRAPKRAATLVEPAHQGPADRLLVQSHASQDKRHRFSPIADPGAPAEPLPHP